MVPTGIHLTRFMLFRENMAPKSSVLKGFKINVSTDSWMKTLSYSSYTLESLQPQVTEVQQQPWILIHHLVASDINTTAAWTNK